MAGTYGAAGTNPYTVKGVDGTLSNEVNATTGVTQVYRENIIGNQQSLGTYDPKTKKFTLQKDALGSVILTDAEIKALSSPEGTKTIRDKAIETSQRGGATNAQQLLSPNAATTPEGQNQESGGEGSATVSEDDQKIIEDELNKPSKQGTRTSYEDVRYPENLRLEHQDCIKFSILEYRPSMAKGSSSSGSGSSISRVVEVIDGVPQIGKKPLGTITLPIPAGINDSNSVDWQSDTLNVLQEKFGAFAQQFVSGGPDAAASEANKISQSLSEFAKSGDAQKGIGGFVSGLAVNSSKFQQRSTGTIFNNNLELLFNGPSLRSFSFTFKLSPRNQPEAKNVMKIIRFFKQAMSVKRSQTSLLLKTPHTFAISYLTSNKQHPYLNKFKECALTGFNVDYTPEGQYMTYMSEGPDGRSMISYQISLTFQELEPIFDDEYGNESPQNILNVGY